MKPIINYRITKYNPSKRNDHGHYLDNSEWTAISDINNPKYNLTYKEYEKIETAYVEAIKLILRANNLNFLVIDSFLRHDPKKEFEKYIIDGRLKNINIDFHKEVQILKNGLKLELEQIEKIVRLILRETVDLTLIANELEIQFGYDYYMYVKSKNIGDSIINKIQKMGLFVEEI